MERIYIQGLGEGITLANLQFFRASINAGYPMVLYCQPTGTLGILNLDTDTSMSIIDAEIKHDLDQAAGDLTEIKKVMQSDIRDLLLRGLKKTFPCSQDFARKLAEQLGLQPSKNKP